MIIHIFFSNKTVECFIISLPRKFYPIEIQWASHCLEKNYKIEPYRRPYREFLSMCPVFLRIYSFRRPTQHLLPYALGDMVRSCLEMSIDFQPLQIETLQIIPNSIHHIIHKFQLLIKNISKSIIKRQFDQRNFCNDLKTFFCLLRGIDWRTYTLKEKPELDIEVKVSFEQYYRNVDYLLKHNKMK